MLNCVTREMYDHILHKKKPRYLDSNYYKVMIGQGATSITQD